MQLLANLSRGGVLHVLNQLIEIGFEVLPALDVKGVLSTPVFLTLELIDYGKTKDTWCMSNEERLEFGYREVLSFGLCTV